VFVTLETIHVPFSHTVAFVGATGAQLTGGIVVAEGAVVLTGGVVCKVVDAAVGCTATAV
jgi:hypothetical protein